MNVFRLLFASLVLFSTLLPASRPAQAAQSFDNCTGFIDTLPTTISTQGVWCLRHDLATNIASGNAITIATNNVTIDCNDYKIGGLAAGTSSQANGIVASNARQNATIRHCNVRGFKVGILINGGAGHLIEDNRLDNNLYAGIWVNGDDSLVQRNRVYDTGGMPNSSESFGISTTADIIDNTVSGVYATAGDRVTTGIFAFGDNTAVRGNQVRHVFVAGNGKATGVAVYGKNVAVVGNHFANTTSYPGYGIGGAGVSNTFCSGNNVAGFATAAITGCQFPASNDNMTH